MWKSSFDVESRSGHLREQVSLAQGREEELPGEPALGQPGDVGAVVLARNEAFCDPGRHRLHRVGEGVEDATDTLAFLKMDGGDTLEASAETRDVRDLRPM